MDEVRNVGFCPHCGNKSPQKLIRTHDYLDTGWAVLDDEPYELSVVVFIVTCEACGNILLYQSVQNIIDGRHFIEADLVYPESGELHDSIPESVAKIYNEAIRIKNLAPNAFAVQIRRALEAVCEDRGAKKGSLQVRLGDLAKKGEIPKTLSDVTDVLRLLGNIGAHASDESVKPYQVYTIDDFFRAVIEYVYVAPSKLTEFRKSLRGFKTGTDTQDSA